MPALPATIWTIGHSTRTLAEFLDLLRAYRIEAIADVRRFPGSRRHPQFASDALAAALQAQGIAYRWLPQLGGRRKARPDSPNTAWRNASFRGYADYMDSAEFAGGLDDLLALATRLRTALMCAEAVWWRCHRSMIADALRVRGIEVVHIAGATHSTVHPYTSVARVVDGRLSYAPPQADLLGAGPPSAS
ncbi:hypothetical protein ASG87_05395 [Frateuria sp. Soil773]|uniref:DUF488 domain-containing protein n=1 Tax=Frateuria sp. Soil773 TaxID=1736407 RepID=UPI0006F435C0|nr:DUF488 domain-containing protein [Frateuria sp. Soil773]KRE88990.1 hypothetical protein ASG87_05395 [Frateuria sp. Soil773]